MKSPILANLPAWRVRVTSLVSLDYGIYRAENIWTSEKEEGRRARSVIDCRSDARGAGSQVSWLASPPSQLIPRGVGKNATTTALQSTISLSLSRSLCYSPFLSHFSTTPSVLLVAPTPYDSLAWRPTSKANGSSLRGWHQFVAVLASPSSLRQLRRSRCFRTEKIITRREKIERDAKTQRERDERDKKKKEKKKKEDMKGKR